MLMPSIFGENLFNDDWMDFSFPDVDKELYGKHAKNVMKTDVKETDNSYEVDIDLPGFKKDEIEAKLENGYLTISAAKGLDKEEKDGKYIRKERYSGAMSRSFYVGDELKQEDIKQRGHAIECRICAEDTENGFIPCPGIIRQLTEPNGIGVRIDSYVYEGYEIPLYYDPMIGKLIVWATNRQFAIERMRRVLYEFKITGLKTNISYLRRIMYAPAFVKGEYDTSFLSKYSRSLQRSNGENEEIENMAMIAAYVDYLFNLEENSPVRTTDSRPISRWREFGLQKGVLRI